jgi:hypothetical protein
MIKTIIILTLLLTLSSRALTQSSSNVRTTLDSLEILKNVGGFVDGYNYPPTAEETRFYNITKMLFGLPFTEVKKLMSDENKFARVYGFLIATKRYFDSLTNSDLQIFNDTAKLPLYTQRGIMDAGITVGQYCEMAYTSAIEEHKTSAKEKDVITSIKQFIKDSSQYPDSYEPIVFTNYTWGGNEEYLFFEIQHKYKLKQVDGQQVEVTNYFILDNQFKIMLIETSRSKTIKSDPPKIEEWIKEFGKKK